MSGQLSASIAKVNQPLPARNISVSGSSENDSGWRNATTVSSFMAYPFLRKIGVFINARIRRLHSRIHQDSAIARSRIWMKRVRGDIHCGQPGGGRRRQQAPHGYPKTRRPRPQRLGPTTRELQLVGLPSTDLSENQMGFEKQQRYSLSWRILPWLSSSGDINNHQDTPPSFQRRTQDSVIAHQDMNSFISRKSRPPFRSRNPR